MSRILIPILLSISLILGLFYFFQNRAKNGLTVLLVPHNDIYSSKIYQFINDHYKPNIKDIIILGTNHRHVGPVISQSEDDHSVQSIIPIVKQIYPDAQITSYIFRPSRDIPQTLSFSNQMKKKYSKKNTLIIVSVDFSHYTSASQSDIYDRETITALKTKDHNQLINWGPEHTDCPDCLIISSDLKNKFTLTHHEYFQGTSYFFGVFD